MRWSSVAAARVKAPDTSSSHGRTVPTWSMYAKISWILKESHEPGLLAGTDHQDFPRPPSSPGVPCASFSPRSIGTRAPSSGAALCARELLELLTAHGADYRVLTTGILDPERETTHDEVLAALELHCKRLRAQMATGSPAEVIDLTAKGVRVPVMPTASSRAERSTDRREADILLERAGQVFDRFRPDALTNCGHPASMKPQRTGAEERLGAFHRRFPGSGTSCPSPAGRSLPERPNEGRGASRVAHGVLLITVSTLPVVVTPRKNDGE